MKFLKLAYIIMKTRIREPLEFFWNLIFPFLAFLLLNFSKANQNLNFNELIYLILPFFSWISFQSSVYGVGLSLVSWRELGLLKTMVQNKTNKFNLICSFVLIQFIFSLFYYLSFWILSLSLFNVNLQVTLIFLGLAVFLLTGLVLSLFSLIFTIIPTTYSSISTIVSILIMPMVWISSQNYNLDNAKIMQIINLFNPLYYVYQILEAIYTNQNINIKEIGFKTFVLLFLFFVGILKSQKRSSSVR